MTTIAVAKMHGAGNDFLVIDARETALERAEDFALRFCDRHTGIGADGVLLIESGASAPFMRIVNADGSSAEMCGNGIRCVAAYLDAAGTHTHAIETLAGRIGVEICEREPTYQVRVAMPVHAIEPFAFESSRGAFVDMGNPHVVLPSTHLATLRELAKRVNELPRFSAGTNVHVSSREAPDAIRVTHFERGAGETLACGTGAVAAALAAIRYDAAPQRVAVTVPGGTLHVEWDGGDVAYLTGPAVRVFDTAVAWP